MGNCIRKDALEPGEVSQFGLHIVQMRSGNLSYLSTRNTRRFGEGKQGADLLNTETKLAGAPDESKPSDVTFVIGSVPARRPHGRRHELDALVIAHGLEINARRPRQLSNGEGFHRLFLLHP